MKEPLLWIVALGLVLAIFFTACKASSGITKKEPVKTAVKHTEWTRNMVLYEINVRQFSKSGTFAGVDSSLTQIKDLGVNVLWFMPVYPIGQVNRKGELGSYYSISDYKGINPEFGNINDFKALVAKAHEMGFHVILDWVGNHTSWDNKMATEHPEWFEKTPAGKFISPFDWSDVIQLDYKAMPLWDYMIDAMKYWVADVGVDGFRCDFPGLIPEKFWYKARTELEAVKPVLLLAEDEEHSYLLNRAFDMNYAWAHHHMMNAVAEGKRKPAALDSLMMAEMKYYPSEAYRLRFLTNHDENSWNGTIKEKMGDAQKAFAAYLFTIPGVPLLYNGQEADLDKRLEFFKRDPIEWKKSDLRPFYTTLCNLRTSNPVLRHGTEGGSFNMIETSRPKKVIAYSRVKEKSTVLAIINFSKDTATVKLKGAFEGGTYRDVFTGEQVNVQAGKPVSLNSWGYLILTK
jgi:glycosidase